MPSREEMIAYITDRAHSASDTELEQYYWFFLFEEEGWPAPRMCTGE